MGNDDLSERALKRSSKGSNWGTTLAELTQRFWHTNNPEIRKVLAAIVLDELYPADIRLAAYCALIEVCGRDLWKLPDVSEFRIPDNLDFEFLNECLS